MGKLIKVPKKNESLQDYRKRLVQSQNNNPLVRIGLLKMIKQFFSLKDVVSCICKIPEPRLKVSENGTYAYCKKCAKTYLQI